MKFIHSCLKVYCCYNRKYPTKHKLFQNSNKWLPIFIILYAISLCVAHMNCPTEYSTVVNSNIKAKWESEKNVQNQVVISEPPCIDEDEKIITRICIDGIWQPPTAPKCARINNNKMCPDNFQSIDDYCVFITKSQMWPAYDIYDYLQQAPKKSYSNDLSEDKHFWLPVKRVVNYGPFEYTDIGTNYGSLFDMNASDYKEYFSADCLLYNAETTKIQPENCTNLHHFVRHFDTNFSFYNCPENCQPAGLTEYKCYCKIYNKMCKNLAAISNFYDKNKLLGMTKGEICRIKDTTPNMLSLKGYHPYLNGSTWQYGKFKPDCSICETKPQEDAVEMLLSFEEKKSTLFLLVYSPEGIKHDKDKYSIYCFTNSAKDHLKTKIDIDDVYKYADKDENNKTPSYSLNVYKVELKEYMGEYWCEAFSSRMSIIKSNKIVAYSRKKGNEYSLRIIINNVCKFYSCKMDKFYDRILDDDLKNIFKRYDSVIRVMEIFKFDIFNDVLDILLHVSTRKNLDVTAEYYNCFSILQFFNNTKNIQIVYFKSSELCLPEKIKINNTELSWPLTKIGVAAVSEELCLMEDGTPATRVCRGDFLYGAKWSDIIGNCVENASVSNVTNSLREIAKGTMALQSFESVWNNISRDTELTVLDIYYIVNILKIFRQADESRSYAVNFLNKLMITNQRTLQHSQDVLNLTDTTLELTDYILSNSSFGSKSVFLVQTQNLIVHVTNPFESNISGLLLYGENNSSLSHLSPFNFKRNDNFENIERHNLQLAVYVPEKILEQILNETENNVSDVNIITTIFYNDSLFLDDKRQSASYVISVTIPGYGSYLESPISVIFKSNESREEMCGFWDNGKRSNLKKGEWSVLGSNYVGRFDENNLHLCSFIHLTHFALLVMSDKKNMVDENDEIVSLNNEDYNELLLEIVTIIGGILSFVGVIGIFLTAILFEKWRTKIGTKILINLSVTILLETICIHLSEIKSLRESEHSCKMIGMLLHYVVLSKFCWMLVYAILQYFRFVKVIGSIPNNLILKSIIFGWGVPLVLVFIVGLTTTQSYVSTSYQLCYPRDLLLYLAVLLPIILIVLANLIVFCIIMYNVIYPKATSCGNNKMFRLKLYLALLLYFMLGLPWVFGILAIVISSSVLQMILYFIFSITGTIQGFVLFLFYVVLNSETRNYWINYIRTKKHLTH